MTVLTTGFKKGLYSFIFALLTLLVGCSSDTINKGPPRVSTTEKSAAIGAASGAVAGSFLDGVGIGVGAAVGGITGGAIGSYMERKQLEQATLLQKVQLQGVQVIAAGDTITIILPSDIFLLPGSAGVNPKKFNTLNLVGEMVASYPTEIIKVSGYTDNRGDPKRNESLSLQQAHAIAHYLSLNGADPRIMYTKGFGETHSVASNETTRGQAANRRVEISFWVETNPML